MNFINLKSFSTLSFFCFVSFANAQVGVNTTDPKTTFDIRSKLGITDADGFQTPRLTRGELTAKGNSLYGSAQTGAIIYITDATNGDNLSQRINITAKGYYYFDGTNWQKMLDSSYPAIISASNGLTASGNNVKLGGSISENTTISNLTATNKLNITGTGVDMLNVDSGTLSVDGANDRAGILTTSPTESLDINGNLRIRNLPLDKSTNTIYTQPNGTASATKDQQFVGVAPLLVDANGVVGVSSVTAKPYTTVKYLVSTGSDEFVADFNTLIRHADYTLIITSAVLTAKDANGISRRVFVSKPTSDTTTRQGASLPEIYPFKSGSRWSIFADYRDVVPYVENTSAASVNFTWEITCLVIDNIFINDVGNRNVTLTNGSGFSPAVVSK